ncbi:MAG: ATP-binding protein [Gallionella sp.]
MRRSWSGHKEGLPERAQFCITQIITASKNLDNLIEDLLKYSRLDTETPTLTEVNLSELMQSILRDRNLTITELGVEVEVKVPLLSLHIWERGLHQVLTNLIDNAIKYSRRSQPPRLTISAEVANGRCRVTVSDNGIGFDMKYHDRIFGLFNRLVRADEFEGTGVGLAIVKKLIEKLGGFIRAESAPGKGATFVVELPVRNERQS